MFRIEKDAETGEHALVAEGGDRILVRDDVWGRLRDAESLFSEWKQLVQKWSIHVDKAPLLKQECPTDQAYRVLRTIIRTYEEAGGG